MSNTLYSAKLVISIESPKKRGRKNGEGKSKQQIDFTCKEKDEKILSKRNVKV